MLHSKPNEPEKTLLDYKNEIWNHLNKKLSDEGKAPYLNGSLKSLYNLLSLYFTNQKDFENFGFETSEYRFPYSLKKGILLMGPPGSGKSFAMEKIFYAFAQYYQKNYYRIMRASELIAAFEKKGLEGMEHFQKIGYKDFAPVNLYIDEIGMKPHIVKYFGTQYKPVEHFIDSRYNIYAETGTKTHASTNLNVKDFKELYEARTYSRLFEMFNFIHVDAEKDLRINYEPIKR